ncbi:hypothetical protein AMTRI_Chr03g143330 [Amborella trichopoda]
MDACRATLCFILFLVITPSGSQEVGNLCHPFFYLSLCAVIFVFPLFLSYFLISSSLFNNFISEDEREFDYLEGSEKGPKHWGELHHEWAACSNGDMQSPNDLLTGGKYKPVQAFLKNRGHDLMLSWGQSGAGTLEINETEYVLKQCHWHSPSEHTFNGSRYSLEVHLVHESKEGKVAVVGITYKIGRSDTFLMDLMNKISSIADSKEAEVQVGEVDPRHIKMGSRKYYRYTGSLTTPPCTQGVA